MANADLKRTKILEAATRRFAHFGMAKTTMAEIAKDLSFSKALLYYYFPDKNSLYSAVFEYVMDEMMTEIGDYISKSDNYEDAMMFTLDKRIELINKYYSLFEQSTALVKEMPAEIEKVIKECFEKEATLLGKVLQIGINKGELEVDDLEDTAKLLLYSLFGMRIGIMKDMKCLIFPTKEEFDFILTLQKKMVKIFLNGLRK
ncbi:Toluene efflux pump ttgABC operon repressor [Sphingobacterium spiritivorum]|uniref:Toluene efflux pump ttgABC operon repressor n=1 Tax=Sphingobacterium spiritivorum TaxID=258 RepID=A0A380BP47_SPHSI|nr:TetR/AcrR family transcriptional regulator [Sphingobacterium spiritivorum]SUJ04577.1 Toluene efflux pump ttgABC operon repressor [Sphingobacterium spiritivorum]